MGVPVTSVAPTLEPIDLPNGGRTDLAVREFNWHMRALMQQAEQGDEAAERALLHACVPAITDAEIDQLDAGEKLWIILYCGRRLEEVTAALKNAAGAEAAMAAPGTPLSAPTTSTSTPSPASPAPSARTGSRKRIARSGRPSTPSIG